MSEEEGDVPQQQRIDELLAELAQAGELIRARDEEISSLKEQLAAAQGSLPRADHSKFEEMQRLQEKLAALKREQAEVDAAKDAAWTQLKSTVVEVVQLANPEKIMAQSSSQWRA
jgi:ABC-type transporter Mla subunit MlaD